MATRVDIPMTNHRARGLYTVPIYVGRDRTRADVLVDTGSSSLVLRGGLLDHDAFESTTLAQEVSYGAGSWKGPIVRSAVEIRGRGRSATLRDVSVALAMEGSPTTGAGLFGGADGILGLAYAALDSAMDLGTSTIAGFTEEAYAAGKPVQIEPYLDDLERHGVVPGVFSIHCRRSTVRSGRLSDAANEGSLILGGGAERSDLCSPPFHDVPVVHDVYYNTGLVAISVGGSTRIPVPAAPPDSPVPSNSIVDSGAPVLALPKALFGKVMAGLPALPPDAPAPSSEAELAAWPEISLTLDGVGGEVTLLMAPSTYWQLSAEPGGVPSFRIVATEAPMSILGLPLLNNYFTVFDRSARAGEGVVRFARLRPR